MSWERISFEYIFSIPTKNGLTKPSRIRGEGFKFINMGELFKYDRIFDPEMELVPLSEKEKITHKIEEFDLLFARQSLIRSGAGKCSIVMEVDEMTVFDSHIIRVRLNQQLCSPLFYFYLFKTSYSGISSLIQQGVQAGIRASELTKLKIQYPPLPTQKRIASILSAYDDLIENNLKRIQLLEEAAQNIYREWFVHFRYPGHEEVPINKETGLPEGWERKPLKEYCNFLEDGDWIETKDQGGGEDYRIIQVSNIGINKFVETGKWRWITKDTFNRLNCREVKKGNILISRMPNGIGRSWIVPELNYQIVTVVDVAILEPNTEIAGLHYLNEMFNSKEHILKCEALATGTTRKRIAKRVLSDIEIIVPEFSINSKFESLLEPIHLMKNKLNDQNIILQEARDILLPRLMNQIIEV